MPRPPTATITLEVAEDALQRRAVRYDKAGDQHYDYISAWIKSTRGSDPDASLYYLAVMLEGGEDPRFIARRMVDPRLRGHRQRRPAGAAGRGRRGRRPSSTSACPSAATRWPSARSTSRWRRSPTPPAGARRRAAPRPRARRAAAARRAAQRRLPGARELGPRQRLRLPARPPGQVSPRSCCRTGLEDARSTSPTTPSRSCATACKRIREARRQLSACTRVSRRALRQPVEFRACSSTALHPCPTAPASACGCRSAATAPACATCTTASGAPLDDLRCRADPALRPARPPRRSARRAWSAAPRCSSATRHDRPRGDEPDLVARRRGARARRDAAVAAGARWHERARVPGTSRRLGGVATAPDARPPRVRQPRRPARCSAP